MSDAIDKIFNAQMAITLPIEGGYSNNPNDNGGPTNWGITQFEARAYGYTGDMQSMPQSTAVAIYKTRYWTAPKFDQIALLDAALGARMLDAGINCGQSTVAEWVQDALNLCNNQGKDYPDIKVDGGIGALTLAAMSAFFAKRGNDGHKVLFNMFISRQSCYYMDIARNNPSQEQFEFGWQLNRAMP